MSLIYVSYEMMDGVAVVTTQVTDINLVSESIRNNFIPVQPIPPAPNQIGKTARLCLDIESRELYYDYVDRPLTPEEKVQLLEQENQELKNRIDLMQQALDDLLLGGM